MKWAFLSPHLDDAVFSCGGLIYELVSGGNSVEIWTICAGDPPSGALSALARALHKRWKTRKDAPVIRRAEDDHACQILGAVSVHFPVPECIYRFNPDTGQPLIGSNDELFQPLLSSEQPLLERVARMLAGRMKDDVFLVSPLALGGHIDHRLVRSAAEMAAGSLYYYMDFPYAASPENAVENDILAGSQKYQRVISIQGLAAWQRAAGAYHTQISTFWGSLEEMNIAIAEYRKMGGGSWILRSPIAEV